MILSSHIDPTDYQKIAAKILMIYQEEEFLSGPLDAEKHDFSHTNSIESGIQCLKEFPKFDIVLLDTDLSDEAEIYTTIGKIHKISKNIQVITLGSSENPRHGVECIKKGAIEYFTKPLDIDLLLKAIPDALQKKQARQVSDLYLSALVHDMNSPLHNINLGVDFLKFTCNKDGMTDKQSNLFRAVESGIWEMRNMISNILNISKFEQGNIIANQRPFSILNALRSPLQIFQDLTNMANKKLEILLDDIRDAPIYADQELFRQVIMNLLNNAMRFTPKHQTITLTGKVLPENWLQFSISNEGSYIVKEHRDIIFDRFLNVQQKVSKGNRNFGLGLTYSKIAINAMGGEIWVESQQEPANTTFHFTIKTKEIRDSLFH